MTLQDLNDLTILLLRDLDPDTLVLVAEDAEGNGFAPLREFGDIDYWSPEDSELVSLVDFEDDGVDVDAEVASGAVTPALVIWP